MGLPTSEEAISAAETELGRRLPNELRERLRRNNGGEVRITGDAAVDDEPDVWEIFPVRDDGSRETMRRSANHIVKAQESVREWPDFPEGVIAFAEDGGGNFLVLDESNEPKLWFHETGELSEVEVTWD